MSRMVFAAVAAFALAGAARADDKYVKIVHVHTGKVLAVTDDSDESAARIMLLPDEAGKEARQWKLEKDGDHLKVVNRKSGKVLDVNEDSRDEGADLILYDAKDDGTDNQRFAWSGDGTERRLKVKSSALVLTAEGDKVVQMKASDDKKKTQLWKVVEVK
jgi:hypothetical protein